MPIKKTAHPSIVWAPYFCLGHEVWELKLGVVMGTKQRFTPTVHLFSHHIMSSFLTLDPSQPSYPIQYTVHMYVHCPENNLNLGIKTEPVTVGADAFVSQT